MTLPDGTTATLNKIGSHTFLDGMRNALQNGCVGNGVANDRAVLNTLANTTLSTGGTIFFPVGTYRISSDITFPAGVTLLFEPNAQLSVDSGKTVTINGSIDAGLSKIFSGAGSFALGRNSAPFVLPQWWGAVGDGVTDDTVACQAALTTSLSVFLAKGDYLISFPLFIGTGQTIYGIGKFSRLVISASATPYNIPSVGSQYGLLFNADMTNGNQYIDVHGIFFDFTNLNTVGHNIHFRKCSYFQVHHCWFKGGNDATAVTASFNYIISNNIAFEQNNACYDNWDSSHDAIISNNIANSTPVGPGAGGIGVLITADVGSSYNISVSNNIIDGGTGLYIGLGIWFQSAGSGSVTNSCRAIGNLIKNVSIGIRVSCGTGHVIAGNTIHDATTIGIDLTREFIGEETKNNVISGNTLVNASSAGTVGEAPIHIQANSSNNSISGNVVVTVAGQYAIIIASGSNNNTFTGNQFDAGTIDQIADGGSGNVVIGVTTKITNLSTSTRIFPGTPAGAYQGAAGLFAGVGAPSNGNGSNGDFYFRSDGGAMTALYQKRAGAWVGIV